MFGIGGGEILIIAVVAVVIFGTDDLPKNLRKFMKVWGDFRGATHDLQRGWLDVCDKVTRDILNEETSAHHPLVESDKESLDEKSSESDGVSAVAEGLTENIIADDSQQSSLPVARKAQGSVALGDERSNFDEICAQEAPEPECENAQPEVSSGADKST